MKALRRGMHMHDFINGTRFEIIIVRGVRYVLTEMHPTSDRCQSKRRRVQGIIV